MKKQVLIFMAGITFLVTVGFIARPVGLIPKAWEMDKLLSQHLPYPDTTMVAQPVPEKYYYALPQRVAYQMYPFYMPGKEPKGYYEWLRKQEPRIIFDAATLRTEADWIRAGEVVYDMPEEYRVMDSTLLASLPELEKHWRKFMKTTPEGIIPFLSIVVREKGRMELGLRACGMCHTKVMPDGSLLKGGQGNFQFTNFNVSVMRVQRDFQKHPESVMQARMQAGKRFVFEAPWIKHESQERLKHLTVEEYMTSFETPEGVLNRQGCGLGYPTSVPDLFHLQARRYFDRTGQLQHRDMGDLMRYATINQALDKLDDYRGFTPFDRPADPQQGNFTRFSDEQLFALAKYIYALKPPRNPTVYPKDLLARGERIFTEQGCVTCHTPPYYSNNKLTPVDGFEPPPSHFRKYDIFNVSVGTDPGLALYTRRGTGYYKVPSLVGAWNRTGFLHSGQLARLEDLLDPQRLKPDYVPTGYKPSWVSHQAVPGHTFGMELNEKEKEALVAFIKSL